MSKLEGVHFVKSDEWTKTGARKRRKPTMDELHARRELLSRNHAASNRLRDAAGLTRVAPSFYWTALCTEIHARGSERAPKRRATLTLLDRQRIVAALSAAGDVDLIAKVAA